MRLHLSCALAFLLGCSSSSPSSTPATATDAGNTVEAAVDSGPPAKNTVETFVELDTTSEGLAFGSDASGTPVLFFGGGDAIWSSTATGTVSKLVDLPGPLGIALRPDGDLVVCGKGEGDVGKSEMPGVLWRVSPKGTKSVLVGPGSVSFKLTNFVAVSKSGALVFSDSAGNKVYRANADGSGVSLVTDAIVYPNGMAFSPDGSKLYVASWSTKKLYVLAQSGDGSFGAPEVFFEGVENVDGIVTTKNGELLLIASGEGLVRIGLDKSKTVVAPGSAFKLGANGAFGIGPFGDRWLYVTNLIGRHLSRVYLDEVGVSLPPK